MLFQSLKKMSQKKYPSGFSIEIEAEFTRGHLPLASPVPDFFDMKPDGSLINGMEFVSQISTSPEKLRDKVDALLSSELMAKRYKASERTSTHIHVNVQEWTKEELLTFLVVYYLVEPLLFNFTGVGRKSNLFCLPLYDAENTERLFNWIVAEEWTNIGRAFDRYKYAALNIASIARLGTVEFRHMYGTNNKKDIDNWINIVNAIVLARTKFRDMAHAFRFFTENRRDFVQRVFGDLLPLVDSPDWFDLVDYNYSSVYYLVNLPEELKRTRVVKKYRFKSEQDLDNLRYIDY